MPPESKPHGEVTLCTRLFPAYYTQFRCLAGQCRDDCCQDWNITFSKKDYLTVKQAKKSPQLEELTRQAVHRLRKGEDTPGREEAYAEFRTHGGHCPFFNQDGLCALQLECGEQTLPWVCRTFPRKEIYTYADWSAALSPACEGVLQLLWDLPDGVDFVMEDLPRPDWRFAPRRPQYLLYPLLRERSIDILQARQFSLEQRLLILGLALDRVRREGWDLDGAAWSRRVDLLLSDPALSQPLAQLPTSRDVFLADRLQIAWRIAPQSPFFQQAVQFLQVSRTGQGEEAVFSCQRLAYDQAEQAMRADLGERLDAFLENLLVSVFFYLNYPQVTTPEDVWRSFVNLCNVWGLMRFSAVVGYGLEPSIQGLFHGVVMASRASLHNKNRMDGLQEKLFSNDSADLAHLAVLIHG